MAIKTKKIEKSDGYIANKQNVAERRREKANAISAMFKGGDEPETSAFEYQLSLIKCLNWYNISVDAKQVRVYLNDYLISTERKKLIPILNRVSDFDIRTLGLLCRLKMRGQYLEELHELSIENRIAILVNSESTIPRQDTAIKKPKIDKNYELSLVYSEAFEEAIDDFVKNKKTKFNPSDYLKSKEVESSVSKKIGEYYATMLSELIESQTDEDLKEGYSNFTTAQLKKFIAFIESIVNACLQRVQSAKVKKPKTVKAVPTIKLVSKLKYLKEFVELGLKSIQPTSIVTSSEVWTYNTKYRKLAIYKSEKGSKLTVKGTSILGFDTALSKQVMLRKPDEFFKNNPIAKLALMNGMKELKTKPLTPNGRINEDTILLGAW
jgi:hypothetical protein